MQTTMTEALAELKTLEKRVASKRDYVKMYVARQDIVRDPHEAKGGSRVIIGQERQAIGDLEARRVAIRVAIQAANRATTITIDGITKSIAEWLTWRKEIAPGQKAFLAELQQGIKGLRAKAIQQGGQINQPQGGTSPQDWQINLDEGELGAQIEAMETTLGTLDGLLSLKNATTLIEV